MNRRDFRTFVVLLRPKLSGGPGSVYDGRGANRLVCPDLAAEKIHAFSCRGRCRGGMRTETGDA